MSMNIAEILTDIGIDSETAKKAEKALNKEIPQNFIPKDQYNKKVLELDDTKKALKESQATAADAETYKTKIAELEAKIGEAEKTHKEALGLKDKEFLQYKSSVETEKTTAAKKALLLKQLSADGANPKLISLLEKEFDLAKIELDGDKIKDWDNISKPVKEQYADIFAVEQKKDFEPGSKPAGNPTAKNYSMEQIKSMSPQEINNNWAAVQETLKKGV